ncbi:MAG: hypothetical protein KJZ78_23180 [Bryobacteraceae bacterium]|nr:hypothetical protein [Bryobacteraceae bacterium]
MGGSWEVVYTMDDWYDGPRGGVADFGGSPHYYRSVYLDYPQWNPDEDRFELTPLPRDAFEAAVELQVIWERWHEAHQVGTALEDPDGERVLPADRAQCVELERVLAAGREANASRAFLLHGEFELGCKRVRWWPVAQATQADAPADGGRDRRF